ncbi:MAG: radical SAM protein [Lachnospiraceae bacterium]|nr:radical SAM protein [Lachnospiraceae bacterium]
MSVNRVLKQITASIYRERPTVPLEKRTNYRKERVNGACLCDLWFLTVGCVHDMHGGCTMCNYGKGSSEIEWDSVVAELREMIKGLPSEFGDFLLTPSGSMLDEREVSAEQREQIIDLLKDIKTQSFIIETRADSITDSGIDFMKRVVPDAEKYIEIGLETSDDWVLKHCVNKNSSFEAFADAVYRLHKNGIHTIANIGMGIPFLSERTIIKSTIQSIYDAFRIGTDSVVLFPFHVRQGTLLEVMYESGMYKPVSLWSLVEVLGHFSQQELDRIQISWYKDYYDPSFSLIRYSPDTCPECRDEVISLLDRYRDTQDQECIRALQNISCECKSKWETNISNQPDSIRINEVEDMYRKLAAVFHIDESLLECELQIMRRDFLRRRKND